MRDLPLVLDIVLSLLVVLGAAFALIGAWGLVKFRDFLKRLHGPTKATTRPPRAGPSTLATFKGRRSTAFAATRSAGGTSW